MSTATTRAQVNRHWRMPWPQLVASLVILAGVTVFLYPQIASWFSQKEQSRVIQVAQEQMGQPPLDNPAYITDRLDEAHEYNLALASGAIFEANTNVATGEGQVSDGSFSYDEILDVTGDGFMGRVRYVDLGIDLPIYHGTSDDTLAKGVGHLEGTSLPVGGIGTRSVLTAHRGLPEATLFNELHRAKEGDLFTVTVLDEVLTYRVAEVRVVEPDETEAIIADQDQDLLTLVTCTPLGINTHRILVTGERVAPTPLSQVEAATESPELPGFPWWGPILATSFLVLAAYAWRSGYTLTRYEEQVPGDGAAAKGVRLRKAQ